jgi:hypothetical protein
MSDEMEQGAWSPPSDPSEEMLSALMALLGISGSPKERCRFWRTWPRS